MIAMMAVGRIAHRVDARLLITIGLALTAFSLWEMTGFTTYVSSGDIIRTGVIQGLGLGFVFVPLSAVTFSTLAPRFRNEGTALFSLMRNIGSSIGISVVITYLAQRTQINHAAMSEYLTPSSIALKQAVESGAWNLSSAAGLSAANAEVTRQALTLAYLQDFRLMMFVAIAAMPLALLLRRAAKPVVGGTPHAALD
jgi:DHA2 family multidrug resistance protein